MRELFSMGGLVLGPLRGLSTGATVDGRVELTNSKGTADAGKAIVR
jgi:hypothetical protein